MPTRKSKKHDPAKVEHWIRYVWPNIKKSHDNGWPLLFWDETNFSLVPIIARTWAERGHVPILYESEKRTSETGIGFITLTPKRRTPRFRFTIYPGSADTESLVFDLNLIHRYFQKTVVLVWDGLPAHKAAERYFRTKHPGWFVFHCLPSYSPELNPVEQCWNEMKNGQLSNFVADHVHALRDAALEAADNLDKRADLLLPKFFKHSRLRL